MAVVDETGSSVVEQMPAKGMVVSSSLTRSVVFPMGLAALLKKSRELNTYLQHNMGKLIYHRITTFKKVVCGHFWACTVQMFHKKAFTHNKENLISWSKDDFFIY